MSSYVTLFPCSASSSQNNLLCWTNYVRFSEDTAPLHLPECWLQWSESGEKDLLVICLTFPMQSGVFWEIFWNGKHSLLVGFFFPDTHTHTLCRQQGVSCWLLAYTHTGTLVWVSGLLDFDLFPRKVFWSNLNSSRQTLSALLTRPDCKCHHS